MALSNQPYLPLYIQDFLTDEKLNECSAEAVGVYIKIMCLMHKSKTYGKILLKQKYQQTNKQIIDFATFFARSLPFSQDEICRGLSELISEDVLQISDNFIMQKRMVKDNDISEKRAKSGSKGGISTSIKPHKKEEKFAQAKTIANADNEIDIVNEIDNKKKYVRDEILEKSILKYFGFTEQINQDKASLVFQFCSALFNADKLEHFKIQFKNYCEFKNTNGYKHKFHNFLGSQSELFIDGAWDEENWEQKIKDLKSSPKKFDENNVIFPNVWEQNFYLKLSTAAKRVEYVSHLKEKIGGYLIMVGVNNSPQWKYPETPKTAPGYILGGIGSIGKEKAS